MQATSSKELQFFEKQQPRQMVPLCRRSATIVNTENYTTDKRVKLPPQGKLKPHTLPAYIDSNDRYEMAVRETKDRDVDTFHAHFRSERVPATGPGQIAAPRNRYPRPAPPVKSLSGFRKREGAMVSILGRLGRDKKSCNSWNSVAGEG